jgi:hypothetical protein
MADDGTDNPHSASARDPLDRIVSGIEAADRVRVDPPAGMWERITAAIADHDPPPAGPPTVVEYSIDARDVVRRVNDDWAAFARHNDAPEIAEALPERPLWTFMDNQEVRDLWQLLVGRVRAHRVEARVPLRCDGPDTRRWFEMTITPSPDGVVHFRSVLLFEEPRPAVALLERHAIRDEQAPPVPVCSWCSEGHDGLGWRPIEEVVRSLRLLEAAAPRLVHGVCPSCRDLMAEELHAVAGGHLPPV